MGINQVVWTRGDAATEEHVWEVDGWEGPGGVSRHEQTAPQSRELSRAGAKDPAKYLEKGAEQQAHQWVTLPKPGAVSAPGTPLSCNNRKLNWGGLIPLASHNREVNYLVFILKPSTPHGANTKHTVCSGCLWACPADTYCLTSALAAVLKPPQGCHKPSAGLNFAPACIYILNMPQDLKGLMLRSTLGLTKLSRAVPVSHLRSRNHLPPPTPSWTHAQNRSESLLECCGSFNFGLKYSPPSGHSCLTQLWSSSAHTTTFPPLFLHPSKFFPRFSQCLLAAFSVIHLSSKCSLNPSHVNPVTPGTCLDWQKAESCLTHVSRLLVYKPLKGTTNHISHLFLCWLSLSFLCQPLMVTQDSLIQPLLDGHSFTHCPATSPHYWHVASAGKRDLPRSPQQ